GLGAARAPARGGELAPGEPLLLILERSERGRLGRRVARRRRWLHGRAAGRAGARASGQVRMRVFLLGGHRSRRHWNTPRWKKRFRKSIANASRAMTNSSA